MSRYLVKYVIRWRHCRPLKPQICLHYYHFSNRRKGSVRRIRRQGYPIRNGLFPDTGKSPASVFFAHLLGKPGTLYFWLAFVQRLISTRSISMLKYKFLRRSKFNSTIINNNIYLLRLGSATLILVPTSLLPLQSSVLLSTLRIFPWASWIPSQSLGSSHRCQPWQLLEIVVRCICLGMVDIVGWWGGDIHQSEDIILARFLSRDARERSCLRRIVTGARCCITSRLISGEGSTLKQCGVETHGSRKWYLPSTEESFLIPWRGGSIFINLFLLRAELSSDIMAILECTKKTESGLRTFFQITAPKNQEDNPDPHEANVLFLVTPGKQESAGQAALRNL